MQSSFSELEHAAKKKQTRRDRFLAEIPVETDLFSDSQRLIRPEEPVAAVQRFIYGLLKSKYLFDQFIIKREFADGKDGWSLKRLHWYSRENVSYINTFNET